jgi:tripartite-type tricarboxylate transporter receptor subunit TctC
MRLRRRNFLHLMAGAATLLSLSQFTKAQSYPVRTVRIIVGFPAGGTTDIGARLIAQWLSERHGQQFIVENRPGAGTHLATEAVARASADGYTLLMATASNAINATLYDRLSYNFIHDIVPVAGVIRSPFVLEVHPAIPVKTVRELIAYAKSSSARITMASFGTGTSSHLTGELFKMMTGVEMLHVPYRGSAPMLIDLLSGQVQVAFDNLPASIEHIRSGKLRPLAVTTATRSEALSNVPALGETVPGFESSAWIGVAAPKGTPAEIINNLTDPKIKARFAELSGVVLGGTPTDFGKHIAEETEKWG